MNLIIFLWDIFGLKRLKKIILRLSKYISDYCKLYIIRDRIYAKSMRPNIVNYDVDFFYGKFRMQACYLFRDNELSLIDLKKSTSEWIYVKIKA